MENSVSYDEFVVGLENRKKTAPNGAEYWLGRDIQRALGYARWESFRDVIEKAQMACESAGVAADNQFRQTAKMVDIGSGAQRQMEEK